MTSTAVDRLGNTPDPATALKGPVRVATTAAITLFGLQTIDGVALAQYDRVLVKDQADQTTNGIYVASSTSWKRASDFDGARDVVKGTRVYIVSGTGHGGMEAILSTADPVVFGSSNIAFTFLSVIDTDIAADLDTVADAITDVTAVAAITADVSTVAAISGDVTQVSSIHTAVSTTATNIAAVIAAPTEAAAAAASATAAGTSETNAATSAAAAAATLASALWRDIVYLTHADSPRAITSADNGKLLVVDNTGGNVVLNMATVASLGEPFNTSVKNESGTNTVTVNRAGSDVFPGAATSVSVDTGGTVMFIGDVSTSPDEWETVAVNGSPLMGGAGISVTGGTASLDIHNLTAKATPVPADEVAAYDIAGAAPKKITITALLAALNGLTEDTSPDLANDFVLSFDTSASTAKKVKPQNLASGGGGVPYGFSTTLSGVI